MHIQRQEKKQERNQEKSKKRKSWNKRGTVTDNNYKKTIDNRR